MWQFPESYPFLWLIIAVLLGIIEALTFGLVTIWFAIGALFAMIAALFGVPLLFQIIIFIVVSSLLLYFTKPILKEFLKVRAQKTNADRVIGEKGLVIERIDYKENTGQVKVRGQVWTARSENDSEIPEGEMVEVKEISGVKLIVARVGNENK